ncbi:GGDEF domain-containing protein [Halomonas urumqiensis]|uniref:diguanylate cyclase n=1 Tax=Halomonas urumqiensis TaxID=1684789 RepID=A0A2N7UNB5_9GAMM|nr:GGDEF domain-containing protein [Halomonas urumqiensis]PMR81906.1 hypothetical protein C1H70_03570 [Halomonas urumqiensis]PTB03989.1 GGDEF domain-containing protein [Halomonas urumqiensis]GHE19750.1 hypothetical protein GCM10017767_02710 [Halomonas urumqiensis]
MKVDGFRIGLVTVIVVLFGLCGLAAGMYMTQARHLVGADYTAMVTDVVRAQEDPVKLRLGLDSLLDSPDSIHIQQVSHLMWLIPQRMESLRHSLENSDLPSQGYAPLLEELDYVKQQLPTLGERVERVMDERTPANLDSLRVLGLEVEEGLAWSYSELNELLHQASAEQRRMMGWLSTAVLLLLSMLVVVVGGLALSLLQIHRQRERLRELSETDALTGLSNRRKMQEMAQHDFARAARQGGALSLLVLDLDLFKEVNDRFGHPAGDKVLKAVADVLVKRVRESDVVARMESDVVARMGGEEFAVLLPDTDRDAATRFAERIRGDIERIALPEPADAHAITVSIGIATAAPGEGFDALYTRADRALYRAKARGRNRLEHA